MDPGRTRPLKKATPLPRRAPRAVSRRPRWSLREIGPYPEDPIPATGLTNLRPARFRPRWVAMAARSCEQQPKQTGETGGGFCALGQQRRVSRRAAGAPRQSPVRQPAAADRSRPASSLSRAQRARSRWLRRGAVGPPPLAEDWLTSAAPIQSFLIELLPMPALGALIPEALAIRTADLGDPLPEVEARDQMSAQPRCRHRVCSGVGGNG